MCLNMKVILLANMPKNIMITQKKYTFSKNCKLTGKCDNQLHNEDMNTF